MTDPDPINVTDEIEVKDAYVTFKNRGFTEGERLGVIVDEIPSWESAFPVPEDEDGNVWYTSNEYGLWWGFKDGEVGVPADESPRSDRHPVEHETAGTERRVPMLDHVVQREVNNEYEKAVNVMFTLPDGSYPSTIPVSLSTANKILKRYVGGPLGSDAVTRYRHKRRVIGDSRWGSAVNVNETELEATENADQFVFVEEWNRDWIPKPVDNVDESDDIYGESGQVVTDGGQIPNEQLREELSNGDVVEYSYRSTDNQQKKGSTGAVCKSNKGGTIVLPEKGAKHILIFKNARVSKKHRDGGATRLTTTVGEKPELTPTGEQRNVEYEQRTGWVIEEQDE